MNKLQIQGAGFPATNNTWRFLHEMIQSLHQLTRLGGTNYILKGVEADGNSYTDGWVVIDGELLPFSSNGTDGTHLVVVESIEQVTYLEDADADGQGDTKDAYYTRTATIGTGDGAVEIASLQKVNPEGLFAIGVAELKAELKATVAMGTSTQVDWSLGVKFDKTLTADSTLTFKNPTENKVIALDIVASGFNLILPNSISNPDALDDYDPTKTNIIEIRCLEEAAGSQRFIASLTTI